MSIRTFFLFPNEYTKVKEEKRGLGSKRGEIRISYIRWILRFLRFFMKFFDLRIFREYFKRVRDNRNSKIEL